jgi:hypothetical protein
MHDVEELLIALGDVLEHLAVGPVRAPGGKVDVERGRCSRLPGFGMNTRRAGSGRHLPPFRSAANSSSSRDTPYSSTSAMVLQSMPATPRLRRTLTHARSRTSLR